jgi:hypothetical protein
LGIALYGYGPDGRSNGVASATQLGPVGGASVGIDFPTATFLKLGLELRGAMQSMGRKPPVLDVAEDIQAHNFGTFGAVSLALNGTFLAKP